MLLSSDRHVDLYPAAAKAPALRRNARTAPARRRPQLPAYTEQASLYEHRTQAYQDFRRRLVELLPAQRGDTVIDVGCGTGLCFPLLQQKVGAAGTIVGLDESAEMLALANSRVTEDGWSNVKLVTAPAECAETGPPADGAVFCGVHDVLQSAEALDNVLAQLRDGAWVGATGGKWAAPWLVGLNMYIQSLHQRYVRSFKGFDRPWQLLADRLDQLRVTEVAGGSGFLLLGQVRAGAA